MLLVVALSLFGLPSLAQAQTIGYAVEPGGSFVQWDEDLGLEDGWLWGGALTFELGSRVRLSPFYLTRSGLQADPTGIGGSDSLFADVDSFEFDARHVGVSMDLDLTDGNVVPFVRLGGGLLRLDPDSGDAIDRVALSYGGGLRFGLGRAGIRLFAEGTSYRLDAEELYTPGLAPEGEEAARRNLVGGVRVSIPISEMPDDPGMGLTGASVPLGIFAGQLNFDSESGLGEQRLAGARGGFALNPLVSLQGFYWQGVNDDLDATEEIKGYGAEAQFNLGSGAGISPFVLVGGGKIEFNDDPELVDEPREDRTALILGGGLTFPLSDRVDLHASVRDYLLDPGEALESTSDPSDLTNNWLYSAGLSVRLGGRTQEGRAQARADAQRESMRESMEEEMARMRRQVDSVEAVARQARTDAEDSTAAEPDREEADEQPTSSEATETRSVQTPDGRVITLPVLEEGSIYIRFGSQGADVGTRSGEGMVMGEAELQASIRRAMRAAGADTLTENEDELSALEERLLQQLRRENAQPDSQAPADTQMSEFSQRVLDRLDEIESRLDAQLQAQAAAPPATRVIEVQQTAPGSGAFDRASRLQPLNTVPYGGIHFGEDTQGTLGVRFDFGPLSNGSPFRFVPEATFGFGGGSPSLLVMGNVQFPVARFGGDYSAEPYLVAGAGFYSPTFLGINTGVGVRFDLDVGSSQPLRTFAELQGLNLYDDTRLLVGVRLNQ